MIETDKLEDCPVCGLYGCDYLIVNNWAIIHVPLSENESRIEKVTVAPGKARFVRK